MRPATGKRFYLRLTVEKMHAFTVFTEKYLWPYRCSSTCFMGVVNCKSPETDVQSEIIEM